MCNYYLLTTTTKLLLLLNRFSITFNLHYYQNVTRLSTSILPAAWIINLASLFSIVFTSAFPRVWAYARMITIFKKGRVDSCDNYRGITITNSIAKVYDYVLYNRLSLWFRPSREQAGAQPK